MTRKNWKNQIQRYQRIEFPDTKTLAYELKAGMANGEPIHYLCITCADKKKKTTLQPNHISLDCPECKSKYTDENATPSEEDGGVEWWRVEDVLVTNHIPRGDSVCSLLVLEDCFFRRTILIRFTRRDHIVSTAAP